MIKNLFDQSSKLAKLIKIASPEKQKSAIQDLFKFIEKKNIGNNLLKEFEKEPQIHDLMKYIEF